MEFDHEPLWKIFSLVRTPNFYSVTAETNKKTLQIQTGPFIKITEKQNKSKLETENE
jgi:hypothetical protein